MKLRNCFLSAVIFSVGTAFAFAEEPVDEDTFRETTYTFNSSSVAEGFNASTLSFCKTAETNASDATMSDNNGNDETWRERNDYTIGYKNNDISPLSQEDSNSAAPDKNESLRVYDFSLSFYDSVTDEIGFTARGDRENPLVFSDVIAEAPINSQLPNQEIFSLLSFDKNVFTNSQNWGQILTGGYYYEEEEEENAFLLFSSMITIPFAILSVSLGVGFLLIVFTSTRNKTNA